MNSIDFIGKHLDRNNLKLQIHEVDTVCSFTGLPIKEGVSNSDLIKKTFTDHAYVKYASGYSSINAALCIDAVLPSEKGFNSLRSYSYLVTDKKLSLLKREDIENILLNPPKEPFILVATYSNKKHTAYKTKVNYSNKKYQVTTDLGNLIANTSEVKKIHKIIKKWYTVNKDTKAQPTHFTKSEILNGCDNTKRIEAYGIDKYFRENEIIQQHRDTAFLKLLTHALNKIS